MTPATAPGPAEELPAPPLTLSPSPPPLRPGTRRLVCGEHCIDYALQRSRRRTIGFLIDDDGLRITAPRWVTLNEIEAAIREKQRWIVAKLVERRERIARRVEPHLQWCDGAVFPFLGRDIVLRLNMADAAGPQGVALDGPQGQLYLSLPLDAGTQQIRDRVLAWMQAEARSLFAERLPVYAEKLGVRYQSFRLTSARTQWGSCTADGRIRLNWRLMHFGLAQIDYVIAHELAHLREMNHSPRFWATVQSVFPDFEEARKTLRERGPETLPVF